MSSRYYLDLVNKNTGEEVSSMQLFGNGDWFPSFVPFLEEHGAKINEKELFIPEEEAIVITDLVELVKAIDEAVWSDIIQANPTYSYTDKFNQQELTSPITDLTRNFMLHDPKQDKPIALNTIYQQAQMIIESSYIFSSYSIVNWLKQQNAVVDEKIRWTSHDYTSRPENDDLIFIGELHQDFELKLTYF